MSYFVGKIRAYLADADGTPIDETNPLPITDIGSPLTNTWTQLTAPGNTASFACTGRKNHTIAVTVANINTNVVVRVEGSLDGSIWGNLDYAGTDTTITSNGTSMLTAELIPLAYIRFVFVSESGGTTATIDAAYMGF